jgi:hypothetical protein
MINAEAAIIRATPLYRRVKDIRHFRRFDKNLPTAAVVIDIICQQDLFTAVPGTPFQHKDLAILKDDFSFHFFQAGRANGNGNIVKKIRADAVCQWLSFNFYPWQGRFVPEIC